MNLYEQIGQERLAKILTEFYVRAFTDPMIGHFFWHHDREHLTTQQIAFATNLLGGPRLYQGRPLSIHLKLPIRPPHFARRQVIMREVMEELGLERELAEAWLALEERLRPQILRNQLSCQH